MSTRAQRHGPKIGGWRRLPIVETPAKPLTDADLAATVYLAMWQSRITGTKTQVMVLALSKQEAIDCAMLRAKRQLLDVDNWDLYLTPMPSASEDTYRAVLKIEGPDEYALRNRAR